MDGFIYQLPARVLDELCRSMDTLSEWDWMQFASYVITDLTQLRKIKAMERVQGVSITRELLWWWGMRQATVQQLLDLLCHLELYRAAHIILSWKQGAETSSSRPDFSEAVLPGPAAASLRSREEDQDPGKLLGPAAFKGPGSALPRANQPASLLPPSEEDAAYAIKTDLPVMSHSETFSTSVPKQERLLSGSVDDLLWSEADVVQATSDFDPSFRISSGTCADVYRGQRHGVPLVIKQLREVGVAASPGTVAECKGPGLQCHCPSPQAACSSPGSLERFLQAEVQVCLRCCHPNVLPLLGFCTGGQCHSLIYPYMANGSLQDRLHGQVLAEVLTGMPAMDSDRNPVYLKDLLLSEIPSSRKTGVQKVTATICQKYLEKREGSLPEDCAEALARAVCLCLQRRNTSVQEAHGFVAAVEERLRGRGALLQCSGLSAGTGSSANAPEETDDVDNDGLHAAFSRRAAPSAGAEAEAGGFQAGSSPQGAPETSWKIEINEAKQKLMENILLYKEEKLDSIELFGP
ncbi:interleukin-1 receptor-associated kinase-like 2 isoform X4 [Octodon degus]|uniref:Interleukin-1 receptor-associated kinase-like 2 isoform X4 n=1 Tax=Octodon degus TaxID=10160 RepID=A0A6P6DMC5_OCTDE|nr:interleukin-1 receptor-associated kinase-like 2 isoform X4 [Octodon degus]